VHKLTTDLKQQQPAFLSVRVSPETRNRIKALAAGRGQSVQDLVGSVLDRFLAEQDRQPPVLSDVVGRLRAHAPALQQRGLAALWVFGSVARGDARPDSDIDLLADFVPDRRMSLTGFASLREDLSALLGAPVDLAEWSVLRPYIRNAAQREAVQVF
jgi:predicted nucleotidyltransferase